MSYWKKREADWLKQCEKEERGYSKELDRLYRQMEDEIEHEIEAFYARYASQNGLSMKQAKEYLSKTDINHYANLAKRYVELAQQDMKNHTTDNASVYFSKKANKEMKRYNTAMRISRLQMLESLIQLRVLNAQGHVHGTIEDALLKRALDEQTRQAGILGKTVIDNMDGAKTIVNASFHGATFSERIWGPHQEALRKGLEKALESGLIQGNGVDKPAHSLLEYVSKKARESGSNAYYYADRLMRTELARVQIQTSMESFSKMGFSEYTFITSAGCCPICQSLDGEHFRIESTEPGVNAPPMHPNCRCACAPYKDLDAFSEWEKQLSPDSLPFDEWMKDHSYTSPSGFSSSGLVLPFSIEEQERYDVPIYLQNDEEEFADLDREEQEDVINKMTAFIRDKERDIELEHLPDFLRVSQMDGVLKDLNSQPYSNVKDLFKGMKTIDDYAQRKHGIIPQKLTHGISVNGGEYVPEIERKGNTSILKGITVDLPVDFSSTGAKDTVIHELVHYMDNRHAQYAGNGSMSSFENDELRNLFANPSINVSPETMGYFRKLYSTVQPIVYKASMDVIQETKDKYPGIIFTNDTRKTMEKMAKARAKAEISKLFPGVPELMDLYDATGHGYFSNNGVVAFGHSGDYFMDPKTPVAEALAEFAVLKAKYPKLLERYKKDFPQHYRYLDNHLTKMLKSLKEAKKQ